MLILDKRKAVDHIVALAVHLADAPKSTSMEEPPEQRSRVRVATFERHALSTNAAPAQRRRSGRRRVPSPQLSPV